MPLLTLGRAGVTGAKAMCILSCPKQSLTAVEASSSQREGQGSGPRPARSSAGFSVELAVSGKEENGERLPLSFEAPLPTSPTLVCRPSLSPAACRQLLGLSKGGAHNGSLTGEGWGDLS